MQQIRQPQQIKKFISGNFFQNDTEDIIIVQEYQLSYCKESSLITLLQTKTKIIDAISINSKNCFSTVLLLLSDEKVKNYSPLENKILFRTYLKNKNNKKKPYKLFFFDNQIYISDYIQGLYQINFDDDQQKQLKIIKGKIIDIQKIQNEIVLFYYEKQKLNIRGINDNNKMEVVQYNYQINQKIKRIGDFCIIYSLKTLLLYNLVTQQISANYSDKFNSNIVDLISVHDNKLIIQVLLENGQIDQISEIQSGFNHQILCQLPIKDIHTCHFTKQQQLCVLSNDQIVILDNKNQIVFQQQIRSLFTKLFEINNSLYVQSQNSVCQIQNQKNIINRNIILKDKQINNLKLIFQVNNYLILLTENGVMLYSQNQQIGLLNCSISIQQAILILDQYLIITDQKQIQLIAIQDQKLHLIDQISQDVLLLQNYCVNQFSIYTVSGSIHIFQIINQKITCQQQFGQFYDISCYDLQRQNYFLISTFDCQLKLYDFNQSFSNNQECLKSQKINSLCISIQFNQENYQIITQNCWILRINFNLEIIDQISLLGFNAFANKVLLGINLSLIYGCQNNKAVYQFITNSEQFIIKIKEDEQLVISNTGQIYSYYQDQLSTIQTGQNEIDYFDVDFLQSQHKILQTFDNIIITKKNIYAIYLDRLQILYENPSNYTYLCDVSENYIVLLEQYQKFQEQKIIKIFRVNQNQSNHLVDIKEIYVLTLSLTYNISSLKIFKDILMIGICNEIQIYSLKTFQKLEQFKAIFPDKTYQIENCINQINAYQQSESQLVLSLLINKAGIALVILKISNVLDIENYKLDKKYHSPIIGCDNLRMEQVQNYWQLFTVRGECRNYKLTKYFFDTFLQPMDEKIETMNDLIIDSINYRGSKFYLGICGGLWKNDQ